MGEEEKRKDGRKEDRNVMKRRNKMRKGEGFSKGNRI